MKNKKRCTFVLTFCVGAVAVGFLAAALATEYWLVAKPVREVDEETEDGAKNVTDGDTGTKFNGYIHLGLFHGHKSLDHGLGLRKGEIWIECIESENLCGWVWGSASKTQQVAEIQDAIDHFDNQTDDVAHDDHGLFNFALWVCTIIFAALGIAWGLVGMGFSLLNACTKPIETITGPMGLYLWYTLACVFSLLSVVVYLVLFYQDLRANVLSLEDRQVFLWTSKNKARLDYSFYCALVAPLLYTANLVVVACSGVQCHRTNYRANMNDKAMDGVMMY